MPHNVAMIVVGGGRPKNLGGFGISFRFKMI